MSNFHPSAKTAQDFNNGIKYVDGVGNQTGDVLHAETINNVIDGFLYLQGLATNQPDVSEAGNTGVVEVSVVMVSDGSAQLKFKNLKGSPGPAGVGISTISANGTDANGGNVYTITLDDGRTYSFTAPRGSGGGSGVVDTTVTATSSNPVQSKGIKQYVDTEISKLNTSFENVLTQI